MIGKLKGIVDYINGDFFILDVNSVGYRIFANKKLLSNLVLGNDLSIWIETRVREDAINLFGFISLEEKNCYDKLVSIQGVGGKAALAILSNVNPDQLIEAVMSQDKTVFSRVNGIGPKIATRIVTELKDKFNIKEIIGEVKVSNNVLGKDSLPNSLNKEATSALVNLGYLPTEAVSVVASVRKSLGDDVTLEKLISGSLSLLSKF